MESSKITFVSDRDGTFDLFLMNADGSNQKNITRTAEWEEDHPRWSPDGTCIAYCDRRHGKGEIYLIDADGRESKATDPQFRHPIFVRIGRRMDRRSSLPLIATTT